MNASENRWARRDRELRSRRFGMRVSGKGQGRIMRDVIVKRTQEAKNG